MARLCLHCGIRPLHRLARAHAQYCSDRCRSAATRARRKLQGQPSQEGAPPAPPLPAQAPPPPWAQLLSSIQAARAQAGLPPLLVDEALTLHARLFAVEEAQRVLAEVLGQPATERHLSAAPDIRIFVSVLPPSELGGPFEEPAVQDRALSHMGLGLIPLDEQRVAVGVLLSPAGAVDTLRAQGQGAPQAP